MLSETTAASERRSTLDPTTRDFAMGVPGFRFSDLFEPVRLRATITIDIEADDYLEAQQARALIEAQFASPLKTSEY